MKTAEILHRYEKYEHYISPVALLAGFIWHLLNLQRIDLFFDNLLIIFYLLICGLTIIFINAYANGRWRSRFFDELAVVLPFLMQFAIGGLFSSFVIFYSESASFLISWPFILIFIILLLGNEFFRQRYQRLAFQMSVYFTAIFSYLIFALPILLDELGAGVFVLSGLASLALIGLFVVIVCFVASPILRQGWRWLVVSLGVIYLVFNFLYFTNIIPPIPLALKASGIAHAVSRSGIDWSAQVESPPWYLFFQDYSPIFHWKAGEPVYCYAIIFAPTEIKTDIYHRWSYFDEKTKKWAERSKIKYTIVGGRDGGYRGYSFKQNIEPGRWRVDVITERGQVLGQMTFEIAKVDSTPELTTLEF